MLPTCRDVSELATDYMERALPLRDSLGMRFHLARCVNCRTYVQQLRKTVAFLRGRTLGEPPAGLAERVADAASQPHGNESKD
jgi:hypothetical protein